MAMLFLVFLGLWALAAIALFLVSVAFGVVGSAWWLLTAALVLVVVLVGMTIFAANSMD